MVHHVSFPKITVVGLALILFFAAGSLSSVRAQTVPAEFLRTLIEVPLCSLLSCTLTEPNLSSVSYDGGGHFVISGEVTGQGREGVWAFSESGQAAGVGDLWRDVGRTSADAHSQSITPFLQFNGTAGFVHSTDDPVFSNTPLTYYELSGDRLSHRSRPYAYTSGSTRRHDSNFPVANDHVVVTYSFDDETVVYRLPSFSEVETRSTSFIPITGVGEFIVAAEGTSANADILLYHVENDGDVTLVGDIPELNRFSAAKYDVDHSANPHTISFLDRSTNVTSVARVMTYVVTEEGLEYAGEKTFTAPAGFMFNTTTHHPFAINGAVTALSMCDGNNLTNSTCGAGVYRNSSYVGLVPSPSFTDATEGEYGKGWGVTGVDISPSGNLVVVNTFGAQLYRLTDTPIPVPPPVPGTPTPPPGIALNGLNDILVLATSYLRLLQAVMGTGSVSPDTSFGVTPTTTPAFQNVFDEALRLINSN